MFQAGGPPWPTADARSVLGMLVHRLRGARGLWLPTDAWDVLRVTRISGSARHAGTYQVVTRAWDGSEAETVFLVRCDG